MIFFHKREYFYVAKHDSKYRDVVHLTMNISTIIFSFLYQDVLSLFHRFFIRTRQRKKEGRQSLQRKEVKGLQRKEVKQHLKKKEGTCYSSDVTFYGN